MLTIIQAVILGLIEGFTEFLPISSTGHLILASKLLQIESTDFVKSFEIFIQLGAILAVVVLYLRRILSSRTILLKIAAGFVPTGIIGFFLYSTVKTYLLGNSLVTLWSLLIGGAWLIIFERWNKTPLSVGTDSDVITYRAAVLIGIFQSLAFIPGVSRAAASIIGSRLLGYSRETAVEFSFLLAIPTMLAATGYDILKGGVILNQEKFIVLGLGFITAFIVALITIKWLIVFIKHHSFTGFGIYRIVLAAALFFLWYF